MKRLATVVCLAVAACDRTAVEPPLIQTDARLAIAEGRLDEDLGVAVRDAGIAVVVPRGRPLPASGQMSISTKVPDQPSVAVELVARRGHRRRLGSYELFALARSPAGDQRTALVLRVDAEGRVAFTATDLETKKARAVRATR